MGKLEVVIDERRRHKGKAQVASINTKLGRITLSKSAYEMMKKRYRRDFDFVQVLMDPDQPKAFWIRACEENGEGSRKINRARQTCTISAVLLLKALKLNFDKTRRFQISWDGKNLAAKVHLTKEV